MSIKRLTANDGKSIREVFEYCFYGDEPEWGDAQWSDYLKLINYDSSLGFFENNKMVSCWIVIDYDIFIRDVLFNMAGICGVATLPEYRQHHMVSKLATESFKIFKEKNQTVSVLYPFKYSFYRKYGYDICCQTNWVESTPNNVLLPFTFKPLKVREESIEESFEKVKSIREKDGCNYNYILYSSVISWRNHHFAIKDTKIFIIENDSGEIEGYFITHLKKEEDGIKLFIDEYNIISDDAFLTILDYVKKHTDQIKRFQIQVHDDERIFDYFDDSNEFSIKYNSIGGAMFRIVDVKQALKTLKFPNELSFTFTMQIKDEYAPWNSKPMIIQIAKGKVKINDNENSRVINDIEMDILALTQLFIGYRAIRDLIKAKKVIIKESLIDLIDKAFPKRKTYLSTVF